ncbi:MAG: C_GCAxxG_C_C family protein [Bryobacterales bacterium]|nr:C_GCAxxG_C_C family protein [Bryobacterales bacterium]
MKKTRRSLIQLAAAGAGSALAAGAAQRNKVLTEKDHFDIGGRGPQIIERARSLGRDYEARYGNCAQCTIAALQESIEFVPDNGDLFLAGSCLAGGATATGNANCGGFTGAGIVIGNLCGRSREQFADRSATKLAGTLMRQVAAKFEESYGSVICREVRAKAGGNCPEVVARAAGWAAEAILKQFAG